MKPATAHRGMVLTVTRGFTYVAAWQWASFVILLLMVWANELIDMNSLLYGAPRRSIDVPRACLATAGVLLTGVIAVGNTYLQQRRIVQGMVAVCSYCRKIRIDPEVWQGFEEFLGDHSNIGMTHGVCPECYAAVMQSLPPDPASGAARKTKA